jgi:hypothetical protein
MKSREMAAPMSGHRCGDGLSSPQIRPRPTKARSESLNTIVAVNRQQHESLLARTDHSPGTISSFGFELGGAAMLSAIASLPTSLQIASRT